MKLRIGTACLVLMAILWLVTEAISDFGADAGLLGVCMLPLAILILSLYFSHGEKTIKVQPPANPLKGARDAERRAQDAATQSTLYWQNEYKRKKDAQ